jgi:hypothetical protein
MTDFNLVTFFSDRIAEDLGIKPEQVTTQFIHEMRKKMYADPDFRFDFSPDSGPPSLKECLKEAERSQRWKTKCQVWGQEALLHGATPY